MGEKQGVHNMGSSPNKDPEQVLHLGAKPLYKQRHCRLCCVLSLLLVLSLATVAVTLSQTIFKFRDPKISLNNVHVQNVSLNFDLASLSTLFSIVVSANAQVDNPNYYDFKYSNSTVLLLYRAEQVGEVELGEGTIRSRKMVNIPAVITVQAVKILLTGLQDIANGVASVVLDAVIPGRVNVARIFKRNVTAMLNCNVDFFIGNQTLKHSNCNQTIKM